MREGSIRAVHRVNFDLNPRHRLLDTIRNFARSEWTRHRAVKHLSPVSLFKAQVFRYERVTISQPDPSVEGRRVDLFENLLSVLDLGAKGLPADVVLVAYSNEAGTESEKPIMVLTHETVRYVARQLGGDFLKLRRHIGRHGGPLQLVHGILLAYEVLEARRLVNAYRKDFRKTELANNLN